MLDDVKIELFCILVVSLAIIRISEVVAGVSLATPPLSAAVTPDTESHVVLTLT